MGIKNKTCNNFKIKTSQICNFNSKTIRIFQSEIRTKAISFSTFKLVAMLSLSPSSIQKDKFFELNNKPFNWKTKTKTNFPSWTSKNPLNNTKSLTTLPKAECQFTCPERRTWYKTYSYNSNNLMTRKHKGNFWWIKRWIVGISLRDSSLIF